jgi:CheY-like chemotaxis protein
LLADYHLDHNRTGLEAVSQLRRHFGHSLRAAILTADRSDDIRRLIAAEQLPMLNKPVKPNRLRALLISLMDTRSLLKTGV